MLFLYSRSTARVLNLYLRHSRPTTQSERDFRKSFNGDCIFCKTGVHKYRASGRPGGLMVPNIHVFSVWNQLHVTLPLPIILRWLPDFWGNRNILRRSFFGDEDWNPLRNALPLFYAGQTPRKFHQLPCNQWRRSHVEDELFQITHLKAFCSGLGKTFYFPFFFQNRR